MKRYELIALMSVALVLSGCGGASSTTGTTTGGGGTTSGVANPITVSGNALQRAGVAWTPHGLETIAFVAAPAQQNSYFLAAYQHYSAAEFTAMKTWGADVVRIQVSQPASDPQGALYSAAFVTSVQAAVTAARAAGLNVIVSIQDEAQSGEPVPETLPNAANQRVWQVYAPLFNGDTGIVYEIMNEPSLTATTANFALWQTAMNAVIVTIRATGAKNVIVADGLVYAESLNGAPLLADSLNSIVYAAHPYFYANGENVAAFQLNFGNFAATSPVIVTEWSTTTTGFCDSGTPAGALALLQYLASNHIGVVGYAYDNPGVMGTNYQTLGSVVQDYNGTPTTLANSLQCGAVGFGPGTLMQNYFKTGTVATVLQ